MERRGLGALETHQKAKGRPPKFWPKLTKAMSDKPEQKRKRGRPETRILKIHCTPEEAMKRIFDAVPPPDPSLRKAKNRPSVLPNDKRPPSLEDII